MVLYAFGGDRGFASHACSYPPFPFPLCFDLILPDSNDSIGLPHQPSVPNIDDGICSGGISRLGSFQLLGACSSQTNMPRKRLSIFAVHDASVFLRYVPTIISLLSHLVFFIHFSLSLSLTTTTEWWFLFFMPPFCLFLSRLRPRMNATQLKKTVNHSNSTVRSMRTTPEVCVVTGCLQVHEVRPLWVRKV